MDGAILQLTSDDLCRTLREIDPIELVLAELTGRTVEPVDDDTHPTGRFVPASGGGSSVELELFEVGRAGVRCLLPRSSLYLLRVAAVTALAARGLLVPGEMTVGLLASGQACPHQLAVLARHVPGINHVAITSAGEPPGACIEPWVWDLLELAGISVSVVATADAAALGANLLIATGPGHERLVFRQLARGALVVNAAGRDLRDDLVDRVDQIYVDDLELVEHHTDRYFVKLHREMAERSDSAPLGQPEGWHRRPGGHRIEAELGLVLTGEHPGRTRSEDILLFELLGTRVLDGTLASQLVRIAMEHELGVWLPEQV